MNNDIITHAKSRHTAKAYDKNRKISPETMEKIKELLRFSASSTNAQPWHFIIISSEEGKQRLAKTNEKTFPFNNPSILNASHTIIFCSRLTMDEEHLAKILEQEELDGRFDSDASLKEKMDQGRKFFINLHKNEYNDLQHWMAKQVYLNVGQFLLGLAALGIDATPMEGIDSKAIDQEFALAQKGYTSLVAVTLGYHDANNDYNAKLPKSRLPYNYILSEI